MIIFYVQCISKNIQFLPDKIPLFTLSFHTLSSLKCAISYKFACAVSKATSKWVLKMKNVCWLCRPACFFPVENLKPSQTANNSHVGFLQTAPSSCLNIRTCNLEDSKPRKRGSLLALKTSNRSFIISLDLILGTMHLKTLKISFICHNC